MIVAGPDGFNKAAYRRFNIRDEGSMPPNRVMILR